MTFFYAIILLGVLIFVHELGHFIMAKLMRVKVLRFSLGFGPRIIGRTFGETEYRVSAIPLGGYVKMLGEEPGEELPEEEKPRAFNYQSRSKRFWIVFSGPLFNLIFAYLLFVILYIGGVPALYPDIGDIMPKSPAQMAGFQKGDRIIEIDGTKIAQWEEMSSIIHNSPGKELVFRIQRGGEVLTLKVTPESKEIANIFGEKKQAGIIGITPLGTSFTKRFNPIKAIGIGALKTIEVAYLTLVSIVKLIQRIIPAETIGGPILIVQMAGKQASQGALYFFSFMAFISINLAVLNLLPIPVLDGGHILLLGIEAVRRRPLSERAILMAQRIGIAFIATLMAFALYNDIVRLLTGGME